MDIPGNERGKWAEELEIIDKDFSGIEFESVGIIGTPAADDKYAEFDRLLDILDTHQRVFLSMEGEK